MDEFEKWLENNRNKNPEGTSGYSALDSILIKYRSLKSKEEPLEPKMGGLVCPRCERVVATPDKAASYLPEPLAVLADRKGYEFRAQNYNRWEIILGSKKHIYYREFGGTSYNECDNNARQYLEGLPGKETK